MDWLTFISSLVRDLAWPTVAAGALIAILLRGPNLVKFVKAIKYKDIEVTIKESFIEARADAEDVRGDLIEQPATEIVPQDRILQLAEIDPSLAIVDIWKKLDAEVIGLMQHNGLMRYTTQEKFIYELAKQGKLSSRDLNLYRRLRTIRNASVHSHGISSPTLSEVIEFRDLVDLLVKKLEQIKSAPDYISVPLPKKQT